MTDGSTPTPFTTCPYDLYHFGKSKSAREPRCRDFGVEGRDEVVPLGELPLPFGASLLGDVGRTTLAGPYYRLPAGTQLPKGYAIVADGSDAVPGSQQPETHHTFFATDEGIPFEDVCRAWMGLPWQYVDKKKKPRTRGG